ncbi:hypothetical protein [Streptantibioticus silvisoli]|uniref:C2H2-type domain-containing protein n=1 Tax=Streptantibioticus silvisoli TaxID=2705255 RepID=A0ABT6W4L9_9ACTN|nr:hypothetical protein [Streptantibioticus silvisoli]MDI5965698.1 hypothetical protein [Streptantibioticus silvisoli]
MSEDTKRLLPTGICWCGCGKTVGLGSFFARGHDKTAEGAILAADYEGSVARMLDANGYGPTNSVTKAAVERGGWEYCPRDCGYAGTPASVRNHLKQHEK